VAGDLAVLCVLLLLPLDVVHLVFVDWFCCCCCLLSAAAFNSLNQSEFMGRTIRVNEARPKEERPPRQRSGYGGGGYGGDRGGYGGGGRGGGYGGERQQRRQQDDWDQQ
jgi:uncharacterized membrane protein YgcG